MILTVRFLEKVSYFNPLLYTLKHIPLNKVNYENECNIICDVYIKNNFDIQIIKKSHKHYIILIKKAIDNCPMKYYNLFLRRLPLF